MAKIELLDRDRLEPMARPTGWFQIGWSHEYPTGAVRPLRYFGKDLVAYRTEPGRLIVADAHCPHFGAHLGFGGRVSGDCIECPFHGWTWGPDGHNVSIPYSQRRHQGKRLVHHPVHETSGLVFMWHASDGEEAWWSPPQVPELTDDANYHSPYPDGTILWEKARLFPQFVLENTVDYAHVKYVHEWLEIPRSEVAEESGECFRSVFSGQIGTSGQTIVLTVDSTAYGVGLTVNRLSGVRETVQTLGVTPVDALHSDLLITVAVQRLDSDGKEIPKVVQSIRHAQLVTAYEQDIPIWANMQYNVTPPYPKEEAQDFLRLRKWSERFYPDRPPYTYD